MLAGAAGGCWPVVSGKTPGRSRAQYPASRPNTRSWAQDPVPRPKTRSASRHVPGETSFQRLLLLDIPQDSAGPQSRGIGGEESWIPGTFLFQAHFMKMAHQPSVRKSHMFPQITRITRIPKWSLDFPNVPLDSPNDLPREGTKQIVLFWGNFPKNIARGTTDPEIDSETWTKLGNNMAPLALIANLTTCIRCKFDHQMAPLALITILTTC